MPKPKKIHLEHFREHRCGAPYKDLSDIELTTDPAEVTCGKCLHIMNHDQFVDKKRKAFFWNYHSRAHNRRFYLSLKYKRQV